LYTKEFDSNTEHREVLYGIDELNDVTPVQETCKSPVSKKRSNNFSIIFFSIIFSVV
jgi:hypothetical protein